MQIRPLNNNELMLKSIIKRTLLNNKTIRRFALTGAALISTAGASNCIYLAGADYKKSAQVLAENNICTNDSNEFVNLMRKFSVNNLILEKEDDNTYEFEAQVGKNKPIEGRFHISDDRKNLKGIIVTAAPIFNSEVRHFNLDYTRLDNKYKGYNLEIKHDNLVTKDTCFMQISDTNGLVFSNGKKKYSNLADNLAKNITAVVLGLLSAFYLIKNKPENPVNKKLKAPNKTTSA